MYLSAKLYDMEKNKILLNEARKKYPKELWGSGYIIRNDSDKITARLLKNGQIKWNSVSTTSGRSTKTGAHWVRCFSVEHAEQIIDYLIRQEGYNINHLYIVKSKNTQKLQLLDVLSYGGEEIPIYVASGDYNPSGVNYYIDKDTNSIKRYPKKDDFKYPNLDIVEKEYLESEDTLKTYILKMVLHDYAWTANKELLKLIDPASDMLRSLTPVNANHIYLRKGYLSKDNKQLIFKIYSTGMHYISTDSDLAYVLKYNSSLKSKLFLELKKSIPSMSYVDVELKSNGISNIPIIYFELNRSLTSYSIEKEIIFKDIVIDENITTVELDKIIDIVYNKILDILSELIDKDIKNKVFNDIFEDLGNKITAIMEYFSKTTSTETFLEDAREYKWLYKTIHVYVSNTYDGGGWECEIPVVNNSINDSIKEYKKSLGRGYWVEYLEPGKMELNPKYKKDSLKEDTTSVTPIQKYSAFNTIWSIYQLSSDNLEAKKQLKELGLSDPYLAPVEDLLILIPNDKKYKSFYLNITPNTHDLNDIGVYKHGRFFSFIDDGIYLIEFILFNPEVFKAIQLLDLEFSYDDSEVELLNKLFTEYGEEQINVIIELFDCLKVIAREYDPFNYSAEEDYSILWGILHDSTGLYDTIEQAKSDLKDHWSELLRNAVNRAEILVSKLHPETFLEHLR